MRLRRMTGAFFVMALVVILAMPAFAMPSFDLYSDLGSWQSAVGGPYELETFDDGTFEDFSVVSEYYNAYPGDVYGTVTGGLWLDRVIYGSYSTTWTFNGPISAFGGYFDLAGPGGPGQSIEIWVDGSWHYVGNISEYTTGFWGFVSDELFTAVRFDGGPNAGAWVETYSLDNLVYKFALDIDIKPGSYPNSIVLKDKGALPVAIFGSEEFDVTYINPETVRIGDVGLRMKPNGGLMFAFEDVNGDGYMDAVFQFSVPELIAAGELTEYTTELTVLCNMGVGTDSVRIVENGN